MSDPLSDALAETLSAHLELGKSRLATLSWLIIGLVNARTVNLSHLAAQCPGSVEVASSYRRLQRFFQFVTLAMAWAYACATVIKGTASIKTKAHGYRAKSWFRLGFDQLRKWILHQHDDAAEIWKRIWPKRKTTLKFNCVV